MPGRALEGRGFSPAVAVRGKAGASAPEATWRDPSIGQSLAEHTSSPQTRGNAARYFGNRSGPISWNERSSNTERTASTWFTVYVIMPDHLHVILTPGSSTTLERAAQLIKGGSSYEIGRALQTHFPVWQPGFTQHLIRSRVDYESHVRYIDANPIRKRLAERPDEYPFCSAHGKYQLDPWPLASGAKAPAG